MPTLICKNCNKEYHVPKYREAISKYCSRECQNHGQYESITKVCPCCNKKFTVSNSRVRKIFCSSTCRHHTNITTIERRKAAKRYSNIRRGTAKSSTLRKFVFSNKEKKCESCGYDEYDFCLDVHHKDENPINNSLENLIVLCAHCHRKLHKGIIQCP